MFGPGSLDPMPTRGVTVRYMERFPNPLRLACIFGVLCLCAGIAAAQSYEIAPTSENYGQQAVGSTSHTRAINLLNTGTTTLTITSFSLTSTPPGQFFLADGLGGPLPPGVSDPFIISFDPTVAGPATGTLTVNIQGLSPAVVTLSGTGLTSKAVATLTTSSIAFPSVAQGANTVQSVTLSNTGQNYFKLVAVNADPPFAVTGFNGVTLQMNPNATLPLQVSLQGTAVGSYTGEVTFTFDSLPQIGITLTGTVTPATAVSITSFPTLPFATQGFPYQAVVNAAGGTPPYTFGVAAGSSLPSGLSITYKGKISGTVASSVAVGNYPFTLNMKDSSTPPVFTTAQLTIPVGAPTQANCNNIIFDIANTANPLVPLTDLGTGTYLGEEGGLYPDGSNVRPSAQDAGGVALADAIVPLDANGNPDPNGKYALLTIGHSETRLESTQFVFDAKADPSVNPKLVLVNGALDSSTTVNWMSPNTSNGVWWTVFNYLLPQAGVTPQQVVAVWVKSVNARPQGTFPSDLTALQADEEQLAQTIHQLLPNVKLAYYSSRLYGGYADGLPRHNYWEPQAYEEGFAVKWTIQDQLNGNANLNWNPANGPVVAPWLSWGPYEWTNGMLGRSDGSVWSCQDSQFDGVHPSVLGQEKSANMLLNFFKTDDTTTPWFLAH